MNVYDEKKLKSMGMNALLGVGQGSINQSFLVAINWNGKNNNTKGLDLVWRTFALIQEMKPKYWVIENVKGLAEFIDKPNDIVRYGHSVHRKSAYLWSYIG